MLPKIPKTEVQSAGEDWRLVIWVFAPAGTSARAAA